MAAAKKKVAKKKAVKSKASESKALMSMADYEKQMADDAQADSARVSSGSEGSFISFNSGSFVLADADIGDSMEVIIVNFASRNEDYSHAVWDKDDLNSPGCAAAGFDDNDYLEPFEESPNKVSDSCETCPNNEWGSAPVGKGKLCKNKKVLALLSADTEPGGELEIAYLRVPPTSMGNFNKYVKGLEKTVNKPTYGLVTQIFIDPDDDKVIKFKSVEPVSNPGLMSCIIEARKLSESVLVAQPDFSNYHVPEKKARATATKKKVSKKKSRFS